MLLRTQLVGLTWLALAAALTPAQAAEIKTVTHGGASYTVCLAHPDRDVIALHWQGPDKQPWAKLQALEAALSPKPVMLMNAGMYHADLKPVGLLVKGGVEIAAVNTTDAPGNFFLKPNGVFSLEKDSPQSTKLRAAVRTTQDFIAQRTKCSVWEATQSGPMLVIGGAIHPIFSQNSANKNLRNGVGVRADGTVCFAITKEERVNLYDFATFFRDSLKCPNALYLDGSISRLWLPANGHRPAQPENFGPIVTVQSP